MDGARNEPLKRLSGIVLRQSTYKLALEAMQSATPPYDTLATFIDNAIETYSRTILNGEEPSRTHQPTQPESDSPTSVTT